MQVILVHRKANYFFWVKYCLVGIGFASICKLIYYLHSMYVFELFWELVVTFYWLPH